MSTDKLQVLIWGSNDFAYALYQLYMRNNICVVGFIDENGLTEFHGIPCRTPKKIQADEHLNKLPIVIASIHSMVEQLPIIDFESIYQFKLKLQEITSEFNVTNQILHPSALLPFIKTKYPNKIIPFGLPGSGIVLLSNISSKIIEHYPKYFTTKDHDSIFMERMCFEYSQCIRQVFTDISHLMSATYPHFAAWKIGTSSFIASLEDTNIYIYGFNTQNHIVDPIYNYHHFPSSNVIDNLTSQGFKLILNERNLFDVILSCVNKNGGVCKETNKMDINIFFDMANWLIGQLKLWYPLPEGLYHFSYDALMQNPAQEISKLINFLGIDEPNTSHVANNIWEQLAFQQINTAPRKHFWQGGINKWENFFEKEHFSLLKFLEIEKILKAYGETELLRKFNKKSLFIKQDTWKKTCTETQRSAIMRLRNVLNGTTYDDEIEAPNNIWGDEKHYRINCFDVLTTNPSHIEILKPILETEFLNRLVLSGKVSNIANQLALSHNLPVYQYQ